MAVADDRIVTARLDLDGIVLTIRRHLEHGDDETDILRESMLGLLPCTHRAVVALAALAVVDLAKRPVVIPE